jgi:hypothetical protein
MEFAGGGRTERQAVRRGGRTLSPQLASLAPDGKEESVREGKKGCSPFSFD